VIKETYRKRKTINGIFLEMELELNLGILLGRELAVERIGYKFVLHDNNKIKARVYLEVYNVDSYILYISSKGCRFYRRNIVEYTEGITVPNTRELWRFLRGFEGDARLRLYDVYAIHRDEMNTICRSIIEEILNTI
jgi:hypothetical protein